MVIDKLKLLQWIEDKKDVYSGPYNSMQDQNKCEGALKVLNMLAHQIDLGEFESEVQSKLDIATEALKKVQSGVYDCDVSPVVEDALKQITKTPDESSEVQN